MKRQKQNIIVMTSTCVRKSGNKRGLAQHLLKKSSKFVPDCKTKTTIMELVIFFHTFFSTVILRSQLFNKQNNSSTKQ